MFYPSPYSKLAPSTYAPVLLIAGTHRVVVGIARSLAQQGLTVDIAEFGTPWQQPIRSKAIRKVHRLPHFESEPGAFRQAMLGLLDREGYDTLMPTTDEAVAGLCRIYEDLVPRGVYPGCPAPAIARKALDKRVTMRIAQDCGIRVPREYRFYTVEELRSRREELEFPLVAKAANRESDITTTVRYFQTFEELERAFTGDANLRTDTLLQEYCTGVGVGIEILMWGGEPKVIFQHRRLRENPPTGGVSILAEAQQPDAKLLDDSVRLLKALSWQGVAMVEFKLDVAKGRWWLMEVNGRYWGSLPLALNAGVPFPYCEWMAAHGLAIPAPPVYPAGKRTLWRLGELHSMLRIVKQWRRGESSAGYLLRHAAGGVANMLRWVPDAVWNWKDLDGSLQEYRLFLKNILCKLPLAIPLGRAVRVGRAHGLAIGLRYVGMRAKRALHLRRSLPPDLEGVHEVLFVCSGNIIRSVLGEKMLRKLLGENTSIRVRSAGLLTVTGRPADPRAVTAGQELGYCLEDHRSTPFSTGLAREADLILVMDDLNWSVLAQRFPEAVRRTHLLAEAFPDPDAGTTPEIDDPFCGDLKDVRACAQRLYRHVSRLSAQFTAQRARGGTRVS